MALSAPVERTLFHTRQVQCTGYHRQDGLWDIEGRMIDTKTYDIGFYDGRQLPAGEPLHQMLVRITVDNDLLIHAAEAFTADAPFPICPGINGAYHALVGQRIGPGFSKKVRELFKGTEGCTHITELLGPMATTAIQTIRSGRQRLAAQQTGQALPPDGARSKEAARLIDSCHGWRSDGEPVAVLFPQHYTGPAAKAD